MYFTFMFSMIIQKNLLEIIRRNRKYWRGALGFFLKLIVNCKYILYTRLFLIYSKKNLMISRLKEPQVRMNDPHEDKATGG